VGRWGEKNIAKKRCSHGAHTIEKVGFQYKFYINQRDEDKILTAIALKAHVSFCTFFILILEREHIVVDIL